MKKTLFIGSPLHDGRVDSCYLIGSIQTDRVLRDKGIPLDIFFNTGESLIARARNNICKVFLNRVCPATNKPYTHLLMIDSDLGFGANEVLRLLEAADDGHHIIAGMAPAKTLNWAAVHDAVKRGVEVGDLQRVATRNVVNLVGGYDYRADKNPVVPVKYAGTGFMLISREALLKFDASYPELRYIPDYTIGDKGFDSAENRMVTAFFDCIISKDEQRYLSEDYTFCMRARDIGFESFVHRNVLLTHVGKFTYQPNPTVV